MPVDKFKGAGLGTKKDSPPICVKFPPEVDKVLRELDDRSTYIRMVVEKALRDDGLLE